MGSNLGKLLLSHSLVAAISATIMYYQKPSETKIVERREVVERVVVKEVAKRGVDRDITTTRKTAPDGSVTETIVDRSREKEEKASEAQNQIASKESKTEITKRKKPSWLIGGGVLSTPQGEIFYSLQMQRRILGNVYLGATGAFNSFGFLGGFGITFQF